MALRVAADLMYLFSRRHFKISFEEVLATSNPTDGRNFALNSVN